MHRRRGALGHGGRALPLPHARARGRRWRWVRACGACSRWAQAGARGRSTWLIDGGRRGPRPIGRMRQRGVLVVEGLTVIRLPARGRRRRRRGSAGAGLLRCGSRRWRSARARAAVRCGRRARRRGSGWSSWRQGGAVLPPRQTTIWRRRRLGLVGAGPIPPSMRHAWRGMGSCPARRGRAGRSIVEGRGDGRGGASGEEVGEPWCQTTRRTKSPLLFFVFLYLISWK